MRSKSWLGITAALLVGVVGCGGDDVQTVATDSTFVAPVVDYDWVADSAMWYDGFYDPVGGTFIAQVTPTSGDGGILEDAGTIDRGTLARLFPRPLSGILAAWRVVVRADCVPMVASVDNDQDGVPASYNATFNCPTQTVGDRTGSITGGIAIADMDDNSKLSGFTVTFSNLAVATSVSGRTRSRTLNGTATLTPSSSGTFQSSTNLTIAFDFTDSGGSRVQGTSTVMEQGTYTPDATTGNDPFASGTVALSGQSTLNRTFGGSSQSRTVTRSTNPTLHWNRSCRTQNADSLGYDSGSVVYADDRGSSVQLQFSGCGNPTVTTH